MYPRLPVELSWIGQEFCWRLFWYDAYQSCGSGSGSAWIRIKLKGKIRIRIRIKVISCTWIRINGIWAYLSTFSRLSLYLEASIRIRIRIKVKGWIRIRIRMRIRIKVTSKIRIGISIRVTSRITATLMYTLLFVPMLQILRDTVLLLTCQTKLWIPLCTVSGKTHSILSVLCTGSDASCTVTWFDVSELVPVHSCKIW